MAFKLLCIDDDPIYSELIKKSFEHGKAQKFKVHLTLDLEEIQKLVKEKKVDAVLLDFKIGDDLKASERIAKSIKKYDEHIPIIMVSGSDVTEYKESMLTKGLADDFHKKPDTHESDIGFDGFEQKVLLNIWRNGRLRGLSKRIESNEDVLVAIIAERIGARSRRDEVRRALKKIERKLGSAGEKLDYKEFLENLEFIDRVMDDVSIALGNNKK